MSKTAIVTTQKNGKGAKRKNSTKQITRKTHRTQKGYRMKHIVKSQMTFKGKGRKK